VRRGCLAGKEEVGQNLGDHSIGVRFITGSQSSQLFERLLMKLRGTVPCLHHRNGGHCCRYRMSRIERSTLG
jgi:hypothetical protein